MVRHGCFVHWRRWMFRVMTQKTDQSWWLCCTDPQECAAALARWGTPRQGLSAQPVTVVSHSRVAVLGCAAPSTLGNHNIGEADSHSPCGTKLHNLFSLLLLLIHYHYDYYYFLLLLLYLPLFIDFIFYIFFTSVEVVKGKQNTAGKMPWNLLLPRWSDRTEKHFSGAIRDYFIFPS